MKERERAPALTPRRQEEERVRELLPVDARRRRLVCVSIALPSTSTTTSLSHLVALPSRQGDPKPEKLTPPNFFSERTFFRFFDNDFKDRKFPADSKSGLKFLEPRGDRLTDNH